MEMGRWSTSRVRAFLALRDFIRAQMRMSHIYQPVMLRTLIVNSGRATIRQIAAEFLARDESQLEYYDEIAKAMPGMRRLISISTSPNGAPRPQHHARSAVRRHSREGWIGRGVQCRDEQR
jgi:hypothetical protein